MRMPDHLRRHIFLHLTPQPSRVQSKAGGTQGGTYRFWYFQGVGYRSYRFGGTWFFTGSASCRNRVC
jgi:hypothetical protein